MHGWGMCPGWGWLFMTLFLVGLVLVLVVLMRVLAGSTGSGRPGGAAPGRDEARQILGVRYARGEISTEEYRARLRALEEE